MKDSLKIRKARQNTRLSANIGPYGIVDQCRNTAVDTKPPTLEAATECVRKVSATQG
jgi:hypothetical protein